MGGNHPAFSYAVLISLAGGIGYAARQHTPSLVGGMALGVGFLGAGMLVITDTISDHSFGHGTSATMSGVIAGVMGRRALMTKMPVPLAIASAGAACSGYHAQQLLNPPNKASYIAGAPPVTKTTPKTQE